MDSENPISQLKNPCVPFDPPPDKKYPLTNKLIYIKKNVIHSVIKHNVSWPFRKPVDVIGLKLIDYYKIIKNPMDLTTIYKRLNSGWYKNSSECVDDFNLIIENCLTYNKPNEDVSRMAEVLRKYFYEKMLKIPQEEFVVTPGKRKEPTADSDSKSPASKKPVKRVKGQSTIQKKCFDVIYELFDIRHADFMSNFYNWPEAGGIGVSYSSNLTEVKRHVENLDYNSFNEFVTDVMNILNRIRTICNPELAPKVSKFKCLFDEILINVGIQHTNEDSLERAYDALLERVNRLEEQVSELRRSGVLDALKPTVEKTAEKANSQSRRTPSKQSSMIKNTEPSRTEQSGDEEDVYTYDEKRKLSFIVTTKLPGDELIKVIQMVKEKEPETGRLNETGEFVFDFQQLKTSTIRQIEQQANDYMRRAEKSLTSGANKRKYSDKFNQETIVERKLELERELDDVKNSLGPSSRKPRPSENSVTETTAAEYRQPLERLSDESDESTAYESDYGGMDLC